jgi:iron(III) transport system permease protein
LATPIAASLPLARGGAVPRDWASPLFAGVALAALALLPWAMSGGTSALGLMAGNAAKWAKYAAVASLAPVVLATALALTASWFSVARLTALFAGIGVASAFAQGFLAGANGPPFGIGAAVALAALTLCLARALGRLGLLAGNATIASIVVSIALLLVLFIFYPIGSALVSAVQDAKGHFAPQLVGERLLTSDIWGLGCLGGGTRCGVAINSALLATIVGVLSTLLGLALALAVQRGGQRYAGVLKLMSVLPVITPPFVVALALVVLFGRTGLITSWLDVLGIPRSRWIYGLPGVAIAQLITFTPISFMLLHGALHAISPALEEAAQTLRGTLGRVFRTVTWPLLRPALANAFLLAFVESLADFGNPIVLAGNFEVLSTKIFFAVAGAQYDAGRAAVLAIVLLALTLLAFVLQQRWVGRTSYVTVSGKGDGGAPAALPRRLWLTCFWIAAAFIVFTLMCYAVILTGGFVRDIGRGDMTPSFRHFLDGFRLEWAARGLLFSGSAWDSLFTTIEVALVAAPLTALVGLLSAYVITRHRFAGRRAFEFLTLVSFAVPGTVIGVSYIVAFNIAPLELTGSMAILVLCFVFRNMPVGVRSGVASLAQIDRTLDEASATLRASTWRTLTRVVMPLLRSAILVTLVFSFTRAMTAVSAVIFLATAKYNLSTVYIINRVEAGEYPLAIVYSTVLMLFMLAVLLGMQRFVGEARLGRRAAAVVVAPQ